MLQILLANLNEGIVIECSVYPEAISVLERDGFQVVSIISELESL